MDGNNNELRALVDLRNRTLQKNRIAFGNRKAAIEAGRDSATNENVALIDRWYERFAELEKECERDIKDLAEEFDIINAMVEIKGVGFMLAAQIVAMIDIHRADTVSALWRYSGYGVVDGQRERHVRGEKSHYNTRLKTILYNLAESFLRSNSPYRKVYDDARAYYDANRPDWTKMHKHIASMRKMIKVFLAHLWERWRIMEGLPIRDLYVIERLGHTHVYTPEQFGWPVLQPDYEQLPKD